LEFDESLDKKGMKAILLDFPNQFAKGLEVGNALVVAAKPRKVFFAGMGGSALPGDIAVACFPAASMSVHKDYGLPNGISKQDLLIAVSYSGNTEETIDCAQQALELGCPIVAVASGGKLKEFAERNGIPFAAVPKGIQPRIALGYQFAACAKALEAAGISGVSNKVLEVALFIEKEKPAVESLAQQCAAASFDKIPVLYCSTELWPAARIAKIAFNENGKVPSFWNVFPESNHNELVGFTRFAEKFHFFFLHSTDDHPRVKKRMQITRALMQEKGATVTDLELKGSNSMQRIFYSVLLFMLAGYYTALAYGQDPFPVQMVENLKSALDK